ncbi:MAG: universal stress protein [Verrucomicrobiales bacterium]|nr:universal stress protein [Verrucomicrobiales bacterium]
MNIDEKLVGKVLVGVDFSTASKCAVVEAVRLAEPQQGNVRVLHIVEEEMIDALSRYSHLDREQILSSISKRLAAFCEEAVGKNGEIKLDVKIGDPVNDFKKVSDEFAPDLVVLGAWGSQRHLDQSTGVTVKQIVEVCSSDVLLMRPRESVQFSHVLACIDFSDYDVPIIKAADHLCLAEDGSLEVLHVFYPPWKKENLTGDDAIVKSADFKAEYTAVLQGRLDALVPLNIHGVSTFKTKTKVLESLEHCEGILHYLKTASPDVAVVGARGQNKIDSMILGHIAERIVTESPCSVYIVKCKGA